MPLLDLQRTYLSTFHLRIGAQAPDKNGDLRPVSLDHFRVTSRARQVVEAFAATYGGTVAEWNEPKTGDRWQVDLPLASLPVLIPPGESLSQWWESWDSGGCLRRCDGETETLTGTVCKCPSDLERRMTEMKGKSRAWCAPTSRLHVVCPEVATLGVGMLTTHSLIVASSLPQSVGIAQALLDGGELVEAILSVERKKGRRQYPLLHLDLVGTSWDQIAAGNGRRAGLPAGDSRIALTASEGATLPEGEAVDGSASFPVGGGEGGDLVSPRCSPNKHAKLMSALRGAGFNDHDSRVSVLSGTLGREVKSSKEVTDEEVETIVSAIRAGSWPAGR